MLWVARGSSQSVLKEINLEYSLIFSISFQLKFLHHWKDQCWSSNIVANWCEELTHWKDPDAGKDWRQEEKGTSPTWWTWVWASPKSCWCNNNRKPDLLQSMNCNESDTTEQLNRTDGNSSINQWEVKLLCFSSFKDGKLETAEGRRVSSVTET